MEENLDKTKTGNTLKVVAMGLDNRIYDAMKSPTFSIEAITRELNSEGINITSQSIRKFIKKTKAAQQRLIATDLATANEIKQLTMDYSAALKGILKEVEEVKNEAREKKDMATYNQLVGKIFQGIELLAKLTGDIKPKGNVDVKVIYNEINMNIEKEMRNIRNEIFKESVLDVDYEIKEEDEKYAKSLIGETND